MEQTARCYALQEKVKKRSQHKLAFKILTYLMNITLEIILTSNFGPMTEF